MTLFILLFGFGGAWAAWAPIDGAALAPGIVMVRSYSKIVQHLEGGIINKIFVEDGARVEAGEPILELDDTQSLAQLEIASSQYYALKALETRLIAEREGLPELTYPSSFTSLNDRTLKILESYCCHSISCLFGLPVFIKFTQKSWILFVITISVSLVGNQSSCVLKIYGNSAPW